MSKVRAPSPNLHICIESEFFLQMNLKEVLTAILRKKRILFPVWVSAQAHPFHPVKWARARSCLSPCPAPPLCGPNLDFDRLERVGWGSWRVPLIIQELHRSQLDSRDPGWMGGWVFGPLGHHAGGGQSYQPKARAEDLFQGFWTLWVGGRRCGSCFQWLDRLGVCVTFYLWRPFVRF